MKFTSHIIVIAGNYAYYMLYRKDTQPKKRRLDLRMMQVESYVGRVIK